MVTGVLAESGICREGKLFSCFGFDKGATTVGTKSTAQQTHVSIVVFVILLFREGSPTQQLIKKKYYREIKADQRTAAGLTPRVNHRRGNIQRPEKRHKISLSNQIPQIFQKYSPSFDGNLSVLYLPQISPTVGHISFGLQHSLCSLGEYSNARILLNTHLKYLSNFLKTYLVFSVAAQ
jgi:hypothetical protein